MADTAVLFKVQQQQQQQQKQARLDEHNCQRQCHIHQLIERVLLQYDSNKIRRNSIAHTLMFAHRFALKVALVPSARVSSLGMCTQKSLRLSNITNVNVLIYEGQNNCVVQLHQHSNNNEFLQ